MPSHAADDTVGATWPWCDVDVESGDNAAESCWRWRCKSRVLLTVVRLRSPRDQSIEVLSHREEVGYSC
jgi:hypothetical protein